VTNTVELSGKNARGLTAPPMCVVPITCHRCAPVAALYATIAWTRPVGPFASPEWPVTNTVEPSGLTAMDEKPLSSMRGRGLNLAFQMTAPVPA
jgi:hypothetical protein